MTPTAAGAAAESAWAWRAHPDVWALMGILLLAYFGLVVRGGDRWAPPGEARVAPRRIAQFTAGVAVLWIAADWPIHDIGERYLLSVHMVQHLLFTLVAPPLMLLGLPDWALRRLLRGPSMHTAVRRLTRPLVAGVLYNAVIVCSHAPAVVNTALRHEALHFALHALLVTAALLMWFPVVNRLPELPRLSRGGVMVYLFLQSVIPTVPASFLTFGTGVLYKFYATVPRPFAISAIDDQQVAGAVMKVAGGMLLWAVIFVHFFRWYAEDRRQKAPDVLTWDDVSRELSRTAPPADPR